MHRSPGRRVARRKSDPRITLKRKYFHFQVLSRKEPAAPGSEAPHHFAARNSANFETERRWQPIDVVVRFPTSASYPGWHFCERVRIPEFASHWDDLGCELRNQRNSGKSKIPGRRLNLEELAAKLKERLIRRSRTSRSRETLSRPPGPDRLASQCAPGGGQ